MTEDSKAQHETARQREPYPGCCRCQNPKNERNPLWKVEEVAVPVIVECHFVAFADSEDELALCWKGGVVAADHHQSQKRKSMLHCQQQMKMRTRMKMKKSSIVRLLDPQ